MRLLNDPEPDAVDSLLMEYDQALTAYDALVREIDASFAERRLPAARPHRASPP